MYLGCLANIPITLVDTKRIPKYRNYTIYSGPTHMHTHIHTKQQSCRPDRGDGGRWMMDSSVLGDEQWQKVFTPSLGQLWKAVREVGGCVG